MAQQKLHNIQRLLTMLMAISLCLFSNISRAQALHAVTPAMVETWMTELSNWGRWGDDDGLGTLNLITPKKRKQAAALVQSGVSVSLSRNHVKEVNENILSPFLRRLFLPAPSFDHTMTGVNDTGAFVKDRISFYYHGSIHSHMDSLCHMSHRGRMYNGYSRDEVNDNGCQKLAITDVKQGIFTRGILIDIARLKGVKYLAPGTPIFVEDIEAWEKKVGVKVQAGDVILVRTGRWSTPANSNAGSAGLHASVAPWLKARDVAMIGGDYANEVNPSGVSGINLPIHQLGLVAMGIRLFDNLDLEALAEEAARQQRWEFLLTAAPLAVEGGTGSPINPIATF